MDKHLITLSPPEVAFATSLAIQRDACKHNRDSRLSGEYTGFGVHLIGVIGEMCFRKVHGGKMNLDILPEGDSHKPDIILPDGRKVEVKSRTWRGDDVHLIFENDELDTLEYASLVQVGLPDRGTVWPVWSREFLLNKLERDNYGYGSRWKFFPKMHLAV